MGNRSLAIDFHNQAVAAAKDRSQTVYLQSAFQLLTASTFHDPSYGEGWYELGNACHDLNAPYAAVAAYRRGLRCEIPTELRAKMLCNLSWKLHLLGQQDEALQAVSKSLELNDESAQAWLNKGVVLGAMGDRAGSLACRRRSVELDPTNPTCHTGLAFSLLFNGDYEEGFREFEHRFEYGLQGFLKYPYPRWTGEEGKTVVLVADQGLGDTLSFARFVEQAAAKCKFMHVVVQSELMSAFYAAWLHISNINLMPLSSPFMEADYWTTFVSLPYALKLTTAQVRNCPQIKLTYYSRPTSWMVPDAKLHIGIAWAGSPLNEINNLRSIPIEHFLRLYQVPGIQLYSLQVGPNSEDLQRIAGTAIVRDLSQYIREVSDTVSLLHDLDLVICCESALGHICSAVDKECWIAYSAYGHDYRIGHRGEQLLWTPKHRIFQQDSSVKWEPVFDRIAKALQEKLGTKRSRGDLDL